MNSDFNKKLDLLQQIKQVDAPPYLLTRIRQQLQNLQHAEAPTKWKWAFAATFLLILLFNISLVLKSTFLAPQKNTGVENIVSSMNLSTTNDLYNE